MMFQTSVGPTGAEKAFRVGVNANTITLTASSIAIGAPVVLATHTASANGYHVQIPATSTSVVNNLYIGNVHDAPGTKAYLGAEEVGLIQVYGYDDDAIVQILTSDVLAGQVLTPESLGFMIPGQGAHTHSAATGTAANVEAAGISGLAILMQAIASSAATSTTTAKVFLRCL